MNKIWVYGIIALLLISSALALGIGARNEQIAPEGKRSLELFIINDEHKNISVEIAVLGNSTGIGIAPDKMNLSSDTYLEKFAVNLDFYKIKNYTIKIAASESPESRGQVSALANIVYTLPIGTTAIKSKNNSEQSVTEKMPYLNLSFGQNSENKSRQIPNAQKSMAKELAGAATKEGISQEMDMGISKNDEIKILSSGLIIFVSILAFNAFFTNRKTPLEKYIIKSRSIGKTDEEIRNRLKEAGWTDLIVDQHLKK